MEKISQQNEELLIFSQMLMQIFALYILKLHIHIHLLDSSTFHSCFIGDVFHSCVILCEENSRQQDSVCS